MCLFTGPVRHVSGTRIYGAAISETHQRLAYAMTVELEGDTAMVLPIPVPPRSAEDAVRFVDMSSCPSFLDDLDGLFEMELLAFGGPQSFGLSRSAPKLVVHEVGEFEASFVPTRGDFARLDARFRIAKDAWSKLGKYDDWGFAVFKLRAGSADRERGVGGVLRSLFGRGAPPNAAGAQRRHPMAFDFPRRDPSELFYPTTHLHDGEVHPVAHFDHELYAQAGAVDVAADGWARATRPVAALPAPARGFVLGDVPMLRKRIRGMQPNDDVTIAA